MRNNMAKFPRVELIPEVEDPLSEIESCPQDLVSFATTLCKNYETPGYAVSFLRLDANDLVYDIYQESYKDIEAPLSHVLAYDIIAMNALLEAVKTNSSQSQTNSRGFINGFSEYEGAVADLPRSLQLDKKRVVAGMPYQVRRLAAAVTPLRLANDVYEQNKGTILEEVQHTVGLAPDEIERVDRLVAELRSDF